METTDPQPDNPSLAQQVQEHLAHSGAQHCQWKEERERQREEHAEQMARMAAIRAEQDASIQQLDALIAERKATPPLQPDDLATTIAQARRMIQTDVHPTWMHAAYADLAGRMERLETTLQRHLAARMQQVRIHHL